MINIRLVHLPPYNFPDKDAKPDPTNNIMQMELYIEFLLEREWMEVVLFP